jgi:DNA-binding NtrC family response regulator
LYGKHIFLVEDDDLLYCRLQETLRNAGGEIIGALAHFPDSSAMIPDCRIDAAVLDIDTSDGSLVALVHELAHRNIPTLCITNAAPDVVPRAPWQPVQIRKPFGDQDLLEKMLKTIYRNQSDRGDEVTK